MIDGKSSYKEVENERKLRLKRNCNVFKRTLKISEIEARIRSYNWQRVGEKRGARKLAVSGLRKSTWKFMKMNNSTYEEERQGKQVPRGYIRCNYFFGTHRIIVCNVI